jgi:hypothetical protein
MHTITTALLAMGPPGIPVLHPQSHYARSIFELSS